MTKVLQPLDGEHSIYQYTDGFSFGTDAVLLAGFLRCRKDSVGVEFGTGTGIIPLLACIHKEFRKIYALEIQEDYAKLAEENIRRNGFSQKVQVICGDLKDASKLVPGPVDFVFSNPPYMKSNTGEQNENEKKRIARHEVCCDIQGVCRSAASLLQDKGDFFCVWRTSRLPELFAAMTDALLEPKNMVLVTPTPTSSPSLVLVRGVKGGKPELKTRPPFVIQDSQGNRTPETELLYEKGILDFGEKA